MKKRLVSLLCWIFISNAQELAMVIIIPSYNNIRWYTKNLDSAFLQNYSNFRVIYIDDCSTDGTGDAVKTYLDAHSDYQKKCTFIRNKHRHGALCNLYTAIHSCADHEIIVTLDGDDWLAHKNVLTKVNEPYQSADIWLTYGQYTIPNYPYDHGAKPIPQEIIATNSFRSWPSIPTHLRTFYAWLFKKIDHQDLLYQGNYFSMAWDGAMMFPMIEMASYHFQCITEPLYIYNIENPLNDHKKNVRLQSNLEKYIRSKPAYTPLLYPS